MDRSYPQETYLPEDRDILHARTCVVDGMSARRKDLGSQGNSAERAECYPRGSVARGDNSSFLCSTSDDKRSAGISTYKGECSDGAGLDMFGRSENEILFKSLLLKLRGVNFSRRLSVKLLGGEKRLERLLEQGKIHATKSEGSSNTMWRFDAAEVAMYVKPNRIFLE